MGKCLDHEKRRAWVARLQRFRASGLTIAKFCANENVAIHTFHYWARRMRPSQSSATRSASSATRAAKTTVAASARVHFRFGGGVEVSMPADCLEAIRCLVQCIQPSSPASPVAFQQVMLRDAAREAG